MSADQALLYNDKDHLTTCKELDDNWGVARKHYPSLLGTKANRGSPWLLPVAFLLKHSGTFLNSLADTGQQLPG